MYIVTIQILELYLLSSILQHKNLQFYDTILFGIILIAEGRP